MKIIKSTSKQLDKIYNRSNLKNRRVEDKVKKIIDEVRLY